MEIVSKLQGPNKKTALNSCAKDKNCVKYGQIRLFSALKAHGKSEKFGLVLLHSFILDRFIHFHPTEDASVYHAFMCHRLSLCLCVQCTVYDYALIANAVKRPREKQRRFEFFWIASALCASQGREERLVRDWIAAWLCKPLARTGGEVCA